MQVFTLACVFLHSFAVYVLSPFSLCFKRDIVVRGNCYSADCGTEAAMKPSFSFGVLAPLLAETAMAFVGTHRPLSGQTAESLNKNETLQPSGWG